MQTIDFTNEIGNKIKIKIKNKKNQIGINHKTKERIKFTAINIILTGPSSMSENIITPKEAEKLYITLKKFLHK